MAELDTSALEIGITFLPFEFLFWAPFWKKFKCLWLNVSQ